MAPDYFLGIDFGTSGVRAIAIDSTTQIQASTRWEYPHKPQESLADSWRHALFGVIGQIPMTVRRQVRAIAINGTSATVLWCDDRGHPVKPPLLYNDDRGQAVMGVLRAIVPAKHIVLSPTSSFAKLLWWLCTFMVSSPDNLVSLTPLSSDSSELSPSGYFLHQADWLAFLLHGKLGISDYHNSLKLGYDVGQLAYPKWMQHIPTGGLKLPRVVAPGTPIAPVLPAVSKRLQLPAECQICAGTTDSIAAFLASGVSAPGDAVTSLGSTLVIKLLSTVRVDDAQYGIYSHRLDGFSPDRMPWWLVGGASNTGGAVLRQFFSDEELVVLSDRIDPSQDTPFNYYPLLKPGERFPINDPLLPPRLTPRPNDDVLFLQGMLEGIARIEAQGFQLLASLGATTLQKVYTAGGGAKNSIWTIMRQRYLGVPVVASAHPEAAYGTARLALKGVTKDRRQKNEGRRMKDERL